MGKQETVFIALGSNLGQRKTYLKTARQILGRVVEIEKVSSIYETPPWGVLDQPKYLNQVVQGRTKIPPLALLQYIKQNEQQIGRQPSIRFGPRVLDMDILFYGDLVLEKENLQIPHPRIAERAFVLVPLNEIAPDWVHPITGQSISQMLADCPFEGEIVPYD